MGADLLVLIPVGLLVLLSLVRFSSTGPSLIRAFGVCALVFGGFLLLRSAVPDVIIWPNSEVARRSRWLNNHLLKTEDWEKRPVIILSGSSSTYYGIDPVQLEKHLAELGMPATVLSFSMPGNTHAERQYMLNEFLNGLPPETRRMLAGANVLFLGEVFDEYDRNPFFRFSAEAFSDRLIQFLNPTIAIRTWKAYSKQRETEPNLPEFETLGLVFQHVLLNRFCAGALSEMQLTTRLRKTPPFFPLGGAKARFNFDQALQNMKNARFDPVMGIPFSQWAISDSQLRKVMAPFVDVYGFYCLPVLEPARAAYQRSFLESLPSGVSAIGPPDSHEQQELQQKDLWFDGVHPTGPGAAQVTRWFASRLAAVLTDVFRSNSEKGTLENP